MRRRWWRRFVPAAADRLATAVSDANTNAFSDSDSDPNSIAVAESIANSDSDADTHSSSDLRLGSAAFERDVYCTGAAQVRYRGRASVSERLI